MKKQTRQKRKEKDPFAKREAGKYTHPVVSREFILDYFNQHPSSYSRKELSHAFYIQSEFEKEAFRRRLRAMVRDGQLTKAGGKYRAIKKLGAVCGTVIGHPDGFGFVEPEDGTSDIFLSAKQMRLVLDGDVVKVQITDIDRRHRRMGIIIEVLKRKRQQIVGRFFIESRLGFVAPDNKRITQDVMISRDEFRGAQSGQIVIAEITSPPTMHSQPIGKIIEVLGDYMAPGLEIEVAIRSYDLPNTWSKKVLQEIEDFKNEISKEIYQARKDLRELPLVTIDGEDAKDFDDAVYAEPLKNKNWRLVVAIADVSYYVKPKMALDKAAQERGNSVYFPGRVVPMLPPILSNGLCSLKPDEDRLCLVCELQIDSSGVIQKSQFYHAVMRSQARLTYKEVGRFLEEKGSLKPKNQALAPQLKHLHQLYKILRKQRQQRGALDFETEEVKVKFSPNKKIKCFVPVIRNDAHRLIEECMLCANMSAAKFLLKHKCTALYRVHDGPNRDKLIDLKEFLSVLGLKLGGGELPTPINYAKLIDQTARRPDAHLIQTLLLRSLSQAFYTADCDPHFGLSVDEYTHFTSPIRRYPDLLVHRAISSFLNHRKFCVDHEILQKSGEHCSMTERRADEATYDALKWLKCEYMLDKLGQTFGGLITGVTHFGLFVSIKDVFVEGLVHIEVLPDDYYQFDKVRHCLVGRRSGKKYCLGDTVKIKVARVNIEQRQIDFVLNPL